MLVTLAEMKSYLGLSTTTYDAFLTSQIAVISDTIEAYCRRRFKATDYTQTFYSNDYQISSQMELYHFPVIGTPTIEVDGDAITDFRVNRPTAILTRRNGFFCGDETVVQYSAGYASIPEPIKSVVYSLVEERYNKKLAGVNLNFGSDVQRISIPGTISVDFDYSLQNNDRKSPFGAILGSYLNVLDYYRSERAIVGSSKLTYVETGDETEDTGPTKYFEFANNVAPQDIPGLVFDISETSSADVHWHIIRESTGMGGQLRSASGLFTVNGDGVNFTLSEGLASGPTGVEFDIDPDSGQVFLESVDDNGGTTQVQSKLSYRVISNIAPEGA